MNLLITFDFLRKMSIEFSKFFGKYIEKTKKYNYNVCVLENNKGRSEIAGTMCFCNEGELYGKDQHCHRR